MKNIIKFILFILIVVLLKLDFCFSSNDNKKIEITFGPRINVTYYDLTDRNPDMESRNVEWKVVKNLINNKLEKKRCGSFNKPSLNITTLNNKNYNSIKNNDSFNGWFNDVSTGDYKNKILKDHILIFDFKNNSFIYENNNFHPIDIFGLNQYYSGPDGYLHNFHFCMEFSGVFLKTPDTKNITIGGDDDSWLFINGDLKIDLGSVHKFEKETYNVGELQNYKYHSINYFHCERHTPESKIYIEIPVLSNENHNFVEDILCSINPKISNLTPQPTTNSKNCKCVLNLLFICVYETCN